ncbi:MAG: protein phosphatase 2C domain-containing protein [Bacteroidaceae bacterium]|nr:protein phosphatase 2C domain-containing protein [Bacteroidaceae bacterium]
MEQILTKYPFLGFLESRIGGRPENQDSFGYVETPDGLLVLVCDGMGGGPGGKIASFTTVEIFKQSILESSRLHQNREEALKLAVERAQAALLNKMQGAPVLKGMGTTIAALYINHESAVVLHIGDSRIYKLRDGAKVFRTWDHSMVSEMVQSGTITEEQARLSAQANIITKAIGVDGKSKPDIDILPFEKGDRFVLCSDGIWSAMPEPQLIKNLSERRSLSNVVDSLSNKVDSLGHDRGNHHDNLTLAMIETKIDSKLKEKMNRKAKLIIGAVGLLLIVSVIFNMVQSYSSSKNQARINKIEELESTIKEKDSEIQTWKDSVELIQKREIQLMEDMQKIRDDVRRKKNLEQRMDGLDSVLNNLQKQQSRNHRGNDSSSSNAVPDFDQALQEIIKGLQGLLQLNEKDESTLKTQLEKKKKEINGELDKIEKEFPDRKQTIKAIKSTIDWEKINKYRGQDGKLTQSGRHQINEIISNIQKTK